MAAWRPKAGGYPVQVVTKRGVLELRMSPASMHEFLRHDLAIASDQILRIARAQMAEHPKRKTFWQLVAYNAMSVDLS